MRELIEIDIYEDRMGRETEIDWAKETEKDIYRVTKSDKEIHPEIDT